MMEQKNNHATHVGRFLVFILTAGVFGIINTEMGVVGILPQIAETFHVTVPEAGWTVSLFALVVALSAPVTPLLFSGVNRRTVMLLSLGVFILSNLVSAFTDNFTLLLITRAVPAFLHPVYVSMAFTVAAASVERADSPKAVARVFVGVSAGMVLGVPVTSFIASSESFSAAMLFFAAVNALAFVATALYVPSLPVRARVSYGTQLRVLKKAITWQSILPVTMINAARCVAIIPFILVAAYLSLFALGHLLIPAAVIILILGILAGTASNGMQYVMENAAPEAPDFANGLFLTSANLGTTLGTSLCGMFIVFFNTRYSVLGALPFLAAGIAFIFLRNRSARLLPLPEQHS